MNMFSLLLKFFKKEQSSQDTLDKMWSDKKNSEDPNISSMLKPGDIKLGKIQVSDNGLSEEALSKISTDKGNLPWFFEGDLLDKLEECGRISGLSDDKKSIIIESLPGFADSLPITRTITPEIICKFFPTYNPYKYNSITLEMLDNVVIVNASDSTGSLFYEQ